MKKFLMIAILAIASLTMSAQSYIGGSLGLIYNINTETVNFTLAPELGYNLNNHLAIGTTIAYVHNYSSVNAFAFEPYVRCTFARIADNKLGFFCDGTIGIGIVKAKHTNAGAFWQIGCNPGISYKLSNHFALIAHLGFLGYQGETDYAKHLVNHNQVGFDFSSENLSLGAHYIF